MTMNQKQLESFLKQPLVAVIGTVDSAGRPRSAPIWFHWEDGAAYMFTGRRTLKWRNLLAVPHASLCDERDSQAPVSQRRGTVANSSARLRVGRQGRWEDRPLHGRMARHARRSEPLERDGQCGHWGLAAEDSSFRP